jgi:hypothetical protein
MRYFGPLPMGRGGVRHILVVLDVFSKFVKLYPLRAATTRACLNKITGHYVTHVKKPKNTEGNLYSIYFKNTACSSIVCNHLEQNNSASVTCDRKVLQ